jgi:hypothetical protein
MDRKFDGTRVLLFPEPQTDAWMEFETRSRKGVGSVSMRLPRSEIMDLAENLEIILSAATA